MFCVTCGKKIDDDARFCPFCGGTVTHNASTASGNPKIQSPGAQGQVQNQQLNAQSTAPHSSTMTQSKMATNQASPIPPQPAVQQNQQGGAGQQFQQQPHPQAPVHQQVQIPVQDDKKKKSQVAVIVALGAACFLLVGVAGFFGFRAFLAYKEDKLSEPVDYLLEGDGEPYMRGPYNPADGSAGDVDISEIVSGLENVDTTSEGSDTGIIEGNVAGTDIIVDNETGRTEIMVDGADSTGNIGGEIAVQPTDNTSYKYTSDQLCDMALDYYEAKKGVRLSKAEATDNGDGTVSIHLTGSDGKNSISMWYRVDMNTASGKDELRDTKIDLNDLTPEIAAVKDTIEETNTGADYILPDADTRKYSKSELSGLSKEELRIARNEIFAKHGRKFRDKELQSYFDSKSWYKGIYEPEEFDKIMNKELNSIELENLDIIKELEK